MCKTKHSQGKVSNGRVKEEGQQDLVQRMEGS